MGRYYREDGNLDWKECCTKRLAKEIKVDDNLANSLLKSSEKKIITQERIIIDETTASSKISLIYEGLRELLEALAIIKGYKIYNHECYASFLREVLNKPYIADKFDDFRKIRNLINYYGKDVSSEEAKPIITGIIELIERIKEEIFD